MERNEMVKEYCRTHTNPIQELCPEINQYFKTSKGYEVWNSRTLVRDVIDFVPNTWSNRFKLPNLCTPRDWYEGFYLHYVEELDALEFARVWLRGNRGQNGIAKEWAFDNYYLNYDRFFIFHNDVNMYRCNGEINNGGKYYCKEIISQLNQWSSRCAVSNESYDEFKKFEPEADLYKINSYRTGEYTIDVWEYRTWYEKDFIKRNKSKKYNDIASYELKDMKIERNLDLKDVEVLLYFQKLDDKYGVIRAFKFPSRWEVDHYSVADVGEEKGRLFISNKGKPTLMIKERDEWKIKASMPWSLNYISTIYNLEEMEKYNPLKYIMPCIDIDNCKLSSFIDILRHPIIEQLFKAGYPNIAKKVSIDNMIPSRLKETFLLEKERKLPLFKLLGVNKFVLNVAEETEMPLHTIREIKYFVGDFDCTKVDYDTCRLIASYVGDDSYSSLTDLAVRVTPSYRWRRVYVNPLSDEQKNGIIRVLKLERKHRGSANLFKDAVSIYGMIINKPDIDMYNVKSYSDIVRLHDTLLAIQQRELADMQAARDEKKRREREEMQKKFKKLQKERIEKFDYENDEFCIRVPRELKEIEDEGIYLHHCVATYENKHARGETTILFLRRKENEEESFYTIEINSNNEVVQIHGMCNRWLGNNPEAVPFVYTYLNKIGAIYDSNVLLNKGSGYCGSHERLDESYLKMIA